MPQWEYQVIHLNVDNGKPGEGPTAHPNMPTPFTKTYLEQEFPEHYSHKPPKGEAGPAPSAVPQHPAQQLQAFFNGHGAKGWSLIGIFPLGPLLMMVMRRRLVSDEPARTQPSAAPEQPALTEVLERLAALEQRLAASPSATSPPRAAAPTARAATGGALQDGSVLPAADLAALAAEPGRSGREAAEALGYRSTASLSNLGNRLGYPAGLVKLGVNGMAAVYRSVDTASGGKPQRIWVVVPRSRLEG